MINQYLPPMISCGEKPRFYFSNMRTDSKPVRFFKKCCVGRRKEHSRLRCSDAVMRQTMPVESDVAHFPNLKKSKKPFGLHRLEAFKHFQRWNFNRILTVLNVLFLVFMSSWMFPISSKNGRWFHPLTLRWLLQKVTPRVVPCIPMLVMLGLLPAGIPPKWWC